MLEFTATSFVPTLLLEKLRQGASLCKLKQSISCQTSMGTDQEYVVPAESWIVLISTTNLRSENYKPNYHCSSYLITQFPILD